MYRDLEANYFDTRDRAAIVRPLEALGYRVPLEPMTRWQGGRPFLLTIYRNRNMGHCHHQYHHKFFRDDIANAFCGGAILRTAPP